MMLNKYSKVGEFKDSTSLILLCSKVELWLQKSVQLGKNTGSMSAVPFPQIFHFFCVSTVLVLVWLLMFNFLYLNIILLMVCFG